MIHKQGAEYKDSTEIAEAVQEEEENRKSIPPALIVACIIGGVILLAVIVYFCIHAAGQGAQELPTSPVTEDIIIGDSSYWDQFDNPDAMFYYTEDEKSQLRAWGYTGDEIEENESNKVPASQLIAESKRLQEEARATLSNPESPEYLELLNSTWLGQPLIALPEYVEGETEGEIYYDTHTLNADYEKITPRGSGLYLKIYLDTAHTSYCFMECPILRYMQLPFSGNIVVQYRTTSINDVTIICDMEEVEVS